ncbi:uncharacterized protein H6S33_009652 [Morchella sextelata]|uniref:uncharacterized protein n=1 Tax=Morchella sextelata TaxID=1174677 RepID=UPI001D039AE1|nr:uncharacterized protein H6S33_009652 [Morchella sextelata]KAH0613272.1 hypothetical protein H6S33_009652 [Morchella sextelata]
MEAIYNSDITPGACKKFRKDKRPKSYGGTGQTIFPPYCRPADGLLLGRGSYLRNNNEWDLLASTLQNPILGAGMLSEEAIRAQLCIYINTSFFSMIPVLHLKA